MRTADFDYSLPPELIAQTPVEPRDSSRLLVLDRGSDSIAHRHFHDLPEHLRPGDLLVVNDSRVIPARLLGRRSTGGAVEALLVHERATGEWEALVRPGRRVRPGETLHFESVTATVLDRTASGGRVLRFDPPNREALAAAGVIPLPPYIHAPLADPERYQTVYAREPGSVAAPTAGLHFTPALVDACRERGADFASLTLHVGPGTFKPVQTDDLDAHPLHAELAFLPPTTVAAINHTHANGGRVISIGTTTVRVLEAAGLASAQRGLSTVPFPLREPADQPPLSSEAPADHLPLGEGEGKVEVKSPFQLRPLTGWIDFFIRPGHQFRVVDALVTNFHLPRSTLLMLVAAFAGRERVLAAYAEAVRHGYRFYSFGDAMLIL
ncbi:MAG: tRNA preQ1(34) S-adenosylmethionine ribosyltransferase-isomerase QueA [Chloroflexi bacterium]|nr:tRNA preQ1(34) S-adenosylmethionine ribosyltransferase-isomerase QueA [Chloroflexota bacterium]